MNLGCRLSAKSLGFLSNTLNFHHNSILIRLLFLFSLLFLLTLFYRPQNTWAVDEYCEKCQGIGSCQGQDQQIVYCSCNSVCCNGRENNCVGDDNYIEKGACDGNGNCNGSRNYIARHSCDEGNKNCKGSNNDIGDFSCDNGSKNCIGNGNFICSDSYDGEAEFEENGLCKCNNNEICDDPN